MSNVTPISRKITMQTRILKNQKTIGGLGNLHVSDWEKRRRIGTGTLYLVSRYF